MVKFSRPVEHSLFGNVKTEIHPKSKASEEHHGSTNGNFLIGRVMVKIDVQKNNCSNAKYTRSREANKFYVQIYDPSPRYFILFINILTSPLIKIVNILSSNHFT